MALTKIRFNNRENKDFFKVLSERVREYFKKKGQSQYANRAFWFKVTLFTIGMWGFYGLILAQVAPPIGQLGLAILFQCTALLFAFNIGHDASHNAISPKKWVNNLMLRTYDLVGISGYLWVIKHCGSHHRFTNIPDYDADIAQQKMIRISPSTQMRWFHKFQFLYAPILYMHFTIFLVYIKDFTMYFSKNIGSEENLKHPVQEIIISILSKSLYTVYALVIPIMVLDIPAGWVVFGFVASHWAASFLAMLVLLPVHLIETSEFTEPDDQGHVDTSWALHQVRVTQDFGTANGIAGWFFGGLNYHIVHHIFPTINHIHYGPVTKIIKKTAEEYGVTYRSNSWFGAIGKHFKFLYKMGRDENAYIRKVEPKAEKVTSAEPVA